MGLAVRVAPPRIESKHVEDDTDVSPSRADSGNLVDDFNVKRDRDEIILGDVGSNDLDRAFRFDDTPADAKGKNTLTNDRARRIQGMLQAG